MGQRACCFCVHDDFPVCALVEVRHKYEDGRLSHWKQGIVRQGAPDYVVDIIHGNGLKESVTVWRSNIRAAKLLVRNVSYAEEFLHLQKKSHGQQFCSTSIVSASKFGTLDVSRWCSEVHTLAISIGFETNVVGGSARDVHSGWQNEKNKVQTQEECRQYISSKRLDYMMSDYAKLFEYKSANHVSDNQLDLLTKLFDEWSCSPRSGHNEVLVNLHPEMIVGIIVQGGRAADVQHVREEFARLFGKQLPVITRRDNFFLVQT